ncbi:MAG: hypothetical protein H5T68_05480 [Chloroflexi bacterium]|nr:hypothetical protein [Chloroflexota bacterium]
MLSWKDILVQQERYKDVFREAEKERLIRQTLARVAMNQHFYSRVLRWLGSQLATWGYRIQERYSTAM